MPAEHRRGTPTGAAGGGGWHQAVVEHVDGLDMVARCGNDQDGDRDHARTFGTIPCECSGFRSGARTGSGTPVCCVGGRATGGCRSTHVPEATGCPAGSAAARCGMSGSAGWSVWWQWPRPNTGDLGCFPVGGFGLGRPDQRHVRNVRPGRIAVLGAFEFPVGHLAFDDAGTGAQPARGRGRSRISRRAVARARAIREGGKCRLVGDVAADDAQGASEGDPVGVLVRLPGGLMHQVQPRYHEPLVSSVATGRHTLVNRALSGSGPSRNRARPIAAVVGTRHVPFHRPIRSSP